MLHNTFKLENAPLIENSNKPRNIISRFTPVQTINNVRIENVLITNSDQQNRLIRLQEIRTKPLDQRVQHLFMELDQLGNYTQVAWFNALDLRDLVRFYRYLYDIWNYRGQLSRELKLKICPMNSPFDFEHNVLRSLYPVEINQTVLRLTCLTVFENFVYTGVDDEHRKLGAFHALTALTMVSNGARTAMSWLYESVM
jgi:hypothetical protein